MSKLRDTLKLSKMSLSSTKKPKSIDEIISFLSNKGISELAVSDVNEKNYKFYVKINKMTIKSYDSSISKENPEEWIINTDRKLKKSGITPIYSNEIIHKYNKKI